MSDLSKEEINNLINQYGFSNILKQFNLTPWKVLELLDDLGYIQLEHFEEV